MNITVDDIIGREAQSLFENFGFTLETGVNIFLRQALREKAIPFEIEIPVRERYIDDEKYFSGKNLEYLLESIKQIEAGKVFEHDLIEA